MSEHPFPEDHIAVLSSQAEPDHVLNSQIAALEHEREQHERADGREDRLADIDRELSALRPRENTADKTPREKR